jgi:putative transcriptional regulator
MVLEIGMRIKLKRIEKGLKQYEFAEMIGISREYLRLLENGTKTNPSIIIMKKISELLEIPVQDLFFYGG